MNGVKNKRKIKNFMLDNFRKGRKCLFFLLYDIVFLGGLILYLPYYFYKKKIDLEGLREKLTIYSQRNNKIFSSAKESIWIQSVSVGEVSLVKGLIKRLKTVTDCPIVISTTTITGRKMAEKLYPDCLIVYFPFDIGFLVKRMIKFLKPKLFISVETEIWPNLYYNLRRNSVPVIILNGRISEEALKRYRKMKIFIKKVLRMVDFVGAQSELYKERYLSLGLDENRVEVTGNLKFTSLDINEDYLLQFKSTYSQLLKKDNELLIIAASTHYPEEEIFLEVYNNLLQKFSYVKLMIAPRHIERVASLEKMITTKGFIPLRVSNLAVRTGSPKEIFILDTIGDLLYFYSLGDICFVGGSLVNYGGHNILEPLYFLKPTIFGSYMSNFQEIVGKVLQKRAAIKISNQEELRNTLEKLIGDEEYRKELSLQALGIFEEEKVSLEKNLKVILKWLD